ncbi:MAG: insulinase family protein [Proteobacteria bacterium]|nr:insulinase family protein [Pseudomonadota bacterium]
MSRTRREAPPVEISRTTGGTTIIVKENHSVPIVSVALYLRGGAMAEVEGRQGITTLMQRMLMKGTATRSNEDIADALEFVGATMAPFTGKDVFGATLNVLSKHLPAALEVFADCLTRPALPEAHLEQERSVLISDIEKRRDDSLSLCLELCERELFQGHSYRFPVSGDIDSLRGLTAEDLRAWHHRFYRADMMSIAIVGDVEAARARDLVAAALGGLPKGEGLVSPVEGLGSIHAPREVLETREKRQSAVALGFRGPACGHADFAAFDVLDHVLSGMGSRLFLELRDKQGLGYVVNSTFDARAQAGAFKLYLGTSEDRRARARAALEEQVVRLREEAVGDEEMERTRRYMLGLHEIALQRNSAQASRLAFYEIMGLGWRFVDDYAARVEAVQSADVLRVAQTYLDPARRVVAEVASRG